MTPRNWLAIAGKSLAALPIVAFFGFPLAFSPGWANGWPFGLTIYSVWSAGMSVLYFLLLMTGGVGLGALVCAGWSYFGGPRSSKVVYAGWLVCCCVLATLLSLRTFGEIYASTLKMWPNGYNP
jgi:hypothetical protein